MKEYQHILDIYSLKGYEMYSKTISREDWGNMAIGEKYLEKYWLPETEYQQYWKSIQDEIFINQDFGFPEYLFFPDFDFIAIDGGRLFEQEDFNKLQECLLQIDQKYFVIIENDFGGKLKEPTFKMKFPVGIEWEELNSGNFASSAFIESIHKEFFVFGDSRLWGKYSANDYYYPLDIIGFKPSLKSLFKNKFPASENELIEIRRHLPEIYLANSNRP